MGVYFVSDGFLWFIVDPQLNHSVNSHEQNAVHVYLNILESGITGFLAHSMELYLHIQQFDGDAVIFWESCLCALGE